MILEVRPVLDLVHLLLPEHAKLLLVLLREVVRLHVIRRELLLLELLAHELLLVRLLRRGIHSRVGLHGPRAGNAVRLLVHQRTGLLIAGAPWPWPWPWPWPCWCRMASVLP